MCVSRSNQGRECIHVQKEAITRFESTALDGSKTMSEERTVAELLGESTKLMAKATKALIAWNPIEARDHIEASRRLDDIAIKRLGQLELESGDGSKEELIGATLILDLWKESHHLFGEAARNKEGQIDFLVVLLVGMDKVMDETL
jgi:hypothetical protein